MKITPRRAAWLGIAGATVIRALGATWRVRMHGCVPDVSDPGHLVAFLHGDMLVPATYYRRTPAAVLISRHGDGELIAQILRRLGRHRPVRGSSTRGGARAVLEFLRRHADVGWAVTPDGPRGPRGRVHDGVIMLAAGSGRPVLPSKAA